MQELLGGAEGLRSLTNTKAIVVDRWGWAIQTSIPAVLDYPVRSVTHSWCAFLAHYVCHRCAKASPRSQGVHQWYGRVPVRRWVAYEDRRTDEDDSGEREVIVRGCDRLFRARDRGLALYCANVLDDLITTGMIPHTDVRRH